MKHLFSIICLSVAFSACKKNDPSPNPQKFANAIVGHWTTDSTTYKSTFADGHVEGGTYAADSSFFQFNTNGTFERYFQEAGTTVQDNTGNNGGVYELKDSLITITVTGTPAVYYDGSEYKIMTISDKSLTLYRVAFGNSPVTNEAWYKYRK